MNVRSIKKHKGIKLKYHEVCKYLQNKDFKNINLFETLNSWHPIKVGSEAKSFADQINNIELETFHETLQKKD